MININSNCINEHQELARLYKDRGDFDVAISKFQSLSKYHFENKDYSKYLFFLNELICMYAEREEIVQIQSIKERIQDLHMIEGVKPTAYAYYILGTCAFHKARYDSALDFFQKALSISLKNEDKTDMCYTISGLVNVYVQLGKLPEALQEIHNLKVFFQVLDLPDLQITMQTLNAFILCKLNQGEKALEVLDNCLENSKRSKKQYHYLQLLYVKGIAYQTLNNRELSKCYLQLLRKSIDIKNHKRLLKNTEAKLSEIGVSSHEEFDLEFDISSNSVIEKNIGKIDFNNQFILLDLLHLFIKSPGEVFSKENIVKKIWNQDYSASIHDNKIYVTIKRLRKMIEPDFNKPKYIFRAKTGYYFNKQSRVRLHG